MLQDLNQYLGIAIDDEKFERWEYYRGGKLVMVQCCGGRRTGGMV